MLNIVKGGLANLLNKHLWILIIVVVSLVIHCLFLVYDPGRVFNDPERYGEEISIYGARDAALYAKMAWQIIEEGVYGYNSEESNAYVTPGLPLYLVLIFLLSSLFNIDHVLLTQIINMVLSVSTIVLLYIISIELFKNRAVAIISAVLYATYFSQLHYFRTLLTEIPGIFMFCLTVLMFIYSFKYKKTWLFILFGFIYAITIMLRPSPAPLVLIGAYIVIKKFGIKKAVKIGALWVTGAAFVLLPWIIRNILVFGEMYIFSSHSGNPLLAGTNPFYLEDFADIAAMGRELGLDDKEYAIERIKEGFASDFPLWLAWFTVGKLQWLFIRPDAWPLYVPKFDIFTRYVYVHHYFVILSGTIFAWLFRKNVKVKSITALIIFYIIISLVFIPIPRFGFFIIPLFCLISGYGIYKIYEQVTNLKLEEVRKKLKTFVNGD